MDKTHLVHESFAVVYTISLKFFAIIDPLSNIYAGIPERKN